MTFTAEHSDDFGPAPEESFERAEPVPKGRSKPDARELPHSLGAERALLGYLLFEPPAILTIKGAGLTPSVFYSSAHATICEAIFELVKQGQTPHTWTLAEHLAATGMLEEVGGRGEIERIANAAVVTWQNSLEVVLQKAAVRELIRRASYLVESAYRPLTSFDEIAPAVVDLSVAFERAVNGRRFEGRSPMSFKVPIDNDPNVLLGVDRYVSRGDGGLLVSTSGVGKSTLTVQAAFHWALGLPFMGIPARKPLRILIVQSEDGDGDVAECCYSCAAMMGLTLEQLGTIDRHILFVRDQINRGDRFIARLGDYVRAHKPDLVILNPLHAFAGCDISDAEEMGRFLREGLNTVNRAEQFAYLIIHHTPKPPVKSDDKKATRQWNEVMYEAAGSAELVNWARFILTLKAKAEPGKFDLILAKRGDKAGVVREIVSESGVVHLQVVTTIPIRHGDKYLEIPGRKKAMRAMFWLPCDEKPLETPPAEEQPTGPKARPGNKTRGQYDRPRMLSYYPVGESRAQPIAQIRRRMIEAEGMSQSNFYKIKEELADDGLIYKADNDRWFRPSG